MRIIGLAILAIAIIGALVFAVMAIQGWRTSNKVTAHRAGLPLKGDLTKKQEQVLLRQLDQAAEIFAVLGQNNDQYDVFAGNVELISERNQTAINAWLRNHQQYRGELQ